MKPFFAWYSSLLLGVLGLVGTGLSVGCMDRVNVAGRHLAERESRASADVLLGREKSGFAPEGHDEKKRSYSWDKL